MWVTQQRSSALIWPAVLPVKSLHVDGGFSIAAMNELELEIILLLSGFFINITTGQVNQLTAGKAGRKHARHGMTRLEAHREVFTASFSFCLLSAVPRTFRALLLITGLVSNFSVSRCA